MIICFVGPADNYHIKKFCKWFSEENHEVHVISFTEGEIENCEVHQIKVNVNVDDSDIKKLKYLLTGRQIKEIIENIKPDVVNVHYATSYGMAMALSGFEGYILSVWGSDVYDFPRKSIFHKMLLKYSLEKAGILFSTSKAMAEECHKYTNKKFYITPFGVDMDMFNPNKRTREDDGKFIVGTVKGLSDKYGIKTILQAVAKVKSETDIPILLRIAGKGPQEAEYKKIATELEINTITTWLGYISQSDAAKEWANMDVALVPSESESFGVSAVEAQACGVPVIITEIPGLMEATKPGKTSIVIQKSSPDELYKCLVELYDSKELRRRYAEKSVDFVRENYELNACFKHIENLYIKHKITF